MKLLIDVDEKYYEACKDAVEEPYPSQIEEVIANGIPYEPKKNCSGCQGDKDFGCEDCLNKQPVDLDREIELYKAKVAFYKSRKIKEYDDTARELKFVVELLETIRSERPQDEMPVCSNCAYFGEKSVTGHCIKCKNNDLLEAKNEQH